MTEPFQIKLFEEDAGEVSPPERGLYLGTSGWSYADWEGTVYEPGTPPAARLSAYVKSFSTVEIDSTFYGTPKRSTVARWRELAPRGFLFAAKFPREITHEKNLVGCKTEAEAFVRTIDGLGDKLGPLLLQLPPDFSSEGSGVLDRFLKDLPGGFRYAVEVRHRSWFDAGLEETLREHGAALTLVDYPGMPRLDEATAPFSYIRWLGNRREFPHGHTGRKRTGPTTSASGATSSTASSGGPGGLRLRQQPLPEPLALDGAAVSRA
ncbi:DUF72 domain-containing protein [Rubrobacter marinus]|uniref:DUF72 domain-containing protein n=1 Tax=Rubrobacter marinus TaxID=2653852 RepID=A0A6G8PYA2_9ACTN|nr:DUF72 domain-containing protein [Rubrobacter marinus]QIN79170.1 DUF72 domain-containing protein [Rubrobacter marinus]